jgi:VIT1/CCC1 family predicted Fe2+/Mn2+ transporter
VLAAQGHAEEEAYPLRHAGATFAAFVVAGAFPLVPYLMPSLGLHRFGASIALTLATLFAVGAARSRTANVRWWIAGLEMLSLGGLVAGIAYGSGALVAAAVAGE